VVNRELDRALSEAVAIVSSFLTEK
jgi:hypothetical protein